MLLREREKLASILNVTAESLDIPDHVYEDATQKYDNVGDHLDAEESALRQYSPRIYVQGSFLLGTVVRPLTADHGYDIDLVCRLSIAKENTTQADLKERVGDRLKLREDLRRILSPSKRCWVLDYPEQDGMPKFHMDVLPCLPNPEGRPEALLLTDTELTRWQKSNPLAYSEWFQTRMKVVLEKRRIAIAESIQANVEDVPIWQVKTPLQRVVQILKRHRDIHFSADADNRPSSIIITTLAAKAYRNEEDIFDALKGIVDRMHEGIEKRNGDWWVPNPVEEENFADKWNFLPDGPKRVDAFGRWLGKLRKDVEELSNATTTADGIALLQESVGASTMATVAERLGVMLRSNVPAIRETVLVPALADDSHALRPDSKWPVHRTGTVKVTGAIYLKQYGKMIRALNDKPIGRGLWIRFAAITDVPKPRTIMWQVVNTGPAAQQRRGDFYANEDPEKGIRWEHTAWRGTHWVKALVIKDGVCVAESERIFVPIR